MSSSTDLFFKPSNLVGMGSQDFNANDAEPNMDPGTLCFFVNRGYGPAIAQYVRNVNGSAMVQGETMVVQADAVTDSAISLGSITAGSTTSITHASLTADVHAGKLCYILDNADSAGAAPEGEVSVVNGNTTTGLTLDADYAFSTAVAASDTAELIGTYQGADCADGDHACKGLGVLIGKNGITNLYYGWAQNYGRVVADITTAATTVHDNVVADAAVLGDGGTDGIELWFGTALVVASADQVAQQVPVKVTLFQAFGLGTP